MRCRIAEVSSAYRQKIDAENSTQSLKSSMLLVDTNLVLIVCDQTVRSFVNDKRVRGGT